MLFGSKLFPYWVRAALICILGASGLHAQSFEAPVSHRLGIHRSRDLRSRVAMPHQRTDPQSEVSLSFGLIDFPRSPDSTANGLNRHGDVVGFYGPNLPQFAGTEQSYLLHGNSFRELKYPGSAYTGVLSINDDKDIVGWYDIGDGVIHAYLCHDGIYSNIDDPLFQNSAASNINNAGAIIGEAYDDTGSVHGFILQGGTYTTIDPPNSIYTAPLGINSAGVIVGNFEDETQVTHGFVYWKGKYTTVDYPGASSTDLTSINDKGQMLGGYGDDVIIGEEDWPDPNPFLLDGGVFTPLKLSVGDAQVAWTYTMKGENFVGLYVDSLGNIYGYEAQIGGALLP